MPSEFVGEQINRIKADNGVSGYWLANELGVSEATISRWARDLERASVMSQRALDAFEKELAAKRRREAREGKR